MKEVLTRRLNEIGVSEDESLSTAPDLLVIDGGKGNLPMLWKRKEKREEKI